jgi:outer membrane immunogenic protein
MKKLLLSTAFAALAVPAIAADLPLKGAPAYAPPIHDPWPGFYLGINAGYGFDLSGMTASQAPFFNGAELATAPQGFTGGIQGGFNYRLGSIFLIGLDTDINGGALKGTAAAPGFITGTSELNWFGSVGGRFGVTPFQNLFVYGFGGLAFGDPTHTFTINNFVNTGAACVGQCSATESGLKTGPAWGFGMEFALDQHWKLGADWRRYDFGKSDVTIAPINAAAPITFDPANRFDVFRARLNYTF